MKRIRFHDLRHTSAVIGLRELGEAVDEVSKRLCHESTAFTLDTYGHLLPQRGRDVAAAFDTLVKARRDAANEKAGSRVRPQSRPRERSVSDRKEEYQLIDSSAIRIELEKVVGEAGFEPATPWPSALGSRSPNWDRV